MDSKIVYNLLDSTISFDKSILEYGKLKKEFDDYETNLAKVVGDFYEENKEYIVDMYNEENMYYEYMYRQLSAIKISIDNHMKKYIKILVEHGIYNKPEDYYGVNCDGLKILLELTNNFYEIKMNLWEQMNNEYRKGLDAAKFNAYSQVQGNQYGIITNSITASILYEIENEYRIKKSMKKADRQFESEMTRIEDHLNSWFENKWMEYFVDYSQRVLSLISNITNELFEEVVSDFIKYDIISEKININKNQSDIILNNMKFASDKRKVLLEALITDPFNCNVYKEICNNQCLSKEIIKFSTDLGMNESILAYLYEQFNYIVLIGISDLEKFNSNIIFLSWINKKEKKDNILYVLKNYIENIERSLKILDDNIYNEKKIDELYSYFSHNSLSLRENVDIFFKKYFVFIGIDDLTQVLDEVEICNMIKSLRSFKSINEALDYFKEGYLKGLRKKEEIEDNRNKEMENKKIRLENISDEESNLMKIVYDNSGKIWGKGARKRKEANIQLNEILQERDKIIEELKELEIAKIDSSNDIPFVDRKISISDKNYLQESNSILLRKKKAKFITDEEYLMLGQKLLDDCTKCKLGDWKLY